ncbi:Gag1p CYBJADRAFT_173042 [Cyberlindnera jadinii NRRL Y-1542]|uniref:Gag1-like clamp domain-containing protein n=1 Tax=Cyberlindnera jadinii (strain ATCC 18201 / CBS 1600 / BCRC 20928 / JCM 3617 / NBRC 0987 / NRRL Y-1542) TaxID=983966 RepID=A0A1E4S2B7_CYBJN|nr:hypothetical protein CYBJADRAFT_173042 [Cyberlindnera jadinii NRRL Y-1542]ODV73639.1 hypothetical protein CYBJADRAFT_173042 [Cyberlindnera jadinii NRRL Y-1542]
MSKASLSRPATKQSVRSQKSQGVSKEQAEQALQQQQAQSKSGFVKAVKTLFLRASLSLSLVSHKLRQFAEDALSSDEVVNELFIVTSSSSLDPSVLEQNSPQSIADDTTSNTMTTTAMEREDSETNLVLWSEFDAVKEADALRQGETPFTKGPEVWQKRRAAWTNGTREQKLQAKQRCLDNSLKLSKENYPVVYSALVERNKTLKKPMNLKDALKVINSGWIANKKWEKAALGLG